MSENVCATLDDLFDILKDNIKKEDVICAKATSQIISSIVNERLKRNMTQQDFADKLNVKQSMVSRWESGNSNFTIKTLSKIAADLDMDLYVNIVPHREVDILDTNTYSKRECKSIHMVARTQNYSKHYLKYTSNNHGTNTHNTNSWKEVSIC